MSESKHTPGPLARGRIRWEDSLRLHNEDRSWCRVLSTVDGVPLIRHVAPWLPTHANSKRLADCWNACEGIPDPERAIPAMREALREIADEANRRPWSYENRCSRVVEIAREALRLAGEESP